MFRSFTINCIHCVLCVGARYDSGGWKNMLHVSALCNAESLFCLKGTAAWVRAQRWEYLSSMINKELNQVFTADSFGSLGQYVHLRNHYSRKCIPVESPPNFSSSRREDTSTTSPFICGVVFVIIAILVLGRSEQPLENK